MTQKQTEIYNTYTSTVNMGIQLCILAKQNTVKLIDQYIDQILKEYSDSELERKCLEYLYEQRQYYEKNIQTNN